jgi:hypothetical protein
MEWSALRQIKRNGPNHIPMVGASRDARMMRPRHARCSRYQRRHFDSLAVARGAPIGEAGLPWLKSHLADC